MPSVCGIWPHASDHRLGNISGILSNVLSISDELTKNNDENDRSRGKNDRPSKLTSMPPSDGQSISL
jgi:hypothetical protein